MTEADLVLAGKRISAAHPPCKSELMLLCEKFQARFGAPPAGTSSLILLNEAAIELSVPRRRLYDIINVLEAVEVKPALAAHVLGMSPVLKRVRQRQGLSATM